MTRNTSPHYPNDLLAKSDNQPPASPAESALIQTHTIRARRQIIGLVVLVLLAIFALPEIIDTEPKPLRDDVVIEIVKNREAPPKIEKQTSIDDLFDPAPRNPQKLAENDKPKESTDAKPKKSTADETNQDKRLTEKSDTSTPNAVKPNTIKSNSIDRPTSGEVNKPIQTASIPSSAAKVFVVQLGLFESAMRAKNLLAQVQTNYPNAYLVKKTLSNKTTFAVHIGEFKSNSSAEVIRARLKQLKIDSVVLKVDKK